MNYLTVPDRVERSVYTVDLQTVPPSYGEEFRQGRNYWTTAPAFILFEVRLSNGNRFNTGWLPFHNQFQSYAAPLITPADTLIVNFHQGVGVVAELLERTPNVFG